MDNDGHHSGTRCPASQCRAAAAAGPAATQVRPGESVIQVFLFLCGFMTIFTTMAIVIVLGRESLLLIRSEYT